MSATYVEWAPPPTSHRLVACTWAARFSGSGAAHVSRVLPDGCIDLLWTRHGLEIAGPDTTSFELGPVPNARVVGLRFLPAVAPAFLGVPASAIVDCHVAAGDVLGARATPLIDALHGAKTAREAANVLLEHTSKWLCAEPDRLVEKTVHDVRASMGCPSVSEMASTIGVSERQLRRRFVDAVGYAPKTFQRITRLRRFVASSAGPRRPLVDLAMECGYADQAHLTREVRALTGMTPASLVGYPVTLG